MSIPIYVSKKRIAKGLPQPSLTKKDKRIIATAVAKVNKTIETKNHLTSSALANIDFTNGSVTNLTAIPTADRLDNQVDPVSINIVGELIVGGSTNLVRVALIRWKVSNATAPTVADIVDDASIYVGNNRSPLAPLRFEKNQRAKFNVLFDRTYTLHQSKQNVIFNIKNRCASQMTFDDGLVTQLGALYLMVWSDDGAVAYPKLTYVSQLVYRDA